MSDKYRSKIVEIEARRLSSRDDLLVIAQWIRKEGGSVYILGSPDDPTLNIGTLEGRTRAVLGDWIIKGTEGEFYPCKPSIFAGRYEPAR